MPQARSIELTEQQCKIVLARIKAARDKADERDKNAEDDASAYPTEGARNLALLGGHYWTAQNKLDIRSINHMAPVAISKHALVTNGRREFIAKATTDEFDDLADTGRGLLNHTWRGLDLEYEAKRAFWDIAALKFGVVEIGWRFDDGAAPEGPAPETADGKPQITMVEGGEAEQGEIERHTPTPHTDDPFIERFDPRDLLIDPQCKRPDFRDARYVGRRKESSVEELKKNPLYKNKDLIKKTKSSYSGKADSSKAAHEVDEAVASDFDLVDVYDMYMHLSLGAGKRAQLYHIVMADGMDKELLCQPYIYEWQAANPYPFEIICNWLPSNDDLQPASDVTQSRHIQIEHDEAYTQICDMRTVATSKLLGPELDDQQNAATIAALVSPKEGEYTPVPTGMEGRFDWLERPPVAMDAYNILESAPDKMRSIWGVNEFQLNETPDRKMLKAEVDAQASQGGTRQESEVEAYNDFCCRIAYKILALLQQFSDRPRKYRYTDKAGREEWGEATLESLRGTGKNGLNPVGIQFAIEIDAAGTGNRNKLSERKQWTDMIGNAMQFKDMGDPFRPGLPLINTANLLREYFKSFDLPNLAEIIQPEPEEGEKIAMLMQYIAQQDQQMQKMAGQLQQMQAALVPPPMVEAPAQGAPMDPNAGMAPALV